MKKAACNDSKENKTSRTATGIEVIASPPKTSPDIVGPEQGSRGHSHGAHYEEVPMWLANLPGRCCGSPSAGEEGSLEGRLEFRVRSGAPRCPCLGVAAGQLAPGLRRHVSLCTSDHLSHFEDLARKPCPHSLTYSGPWGQPWSLWVDVPSAADVTGEMGWGPPGTVNSRWASTPRTSWPCLLSRCGVRAEARKVQSSGREPPSAGVRR